MAMAVLSVVLFSCVREEMTCDKELIVVQRIGEGGYVYTRGTVISSNTDLKEETFGLLRLTDSQCFCSPIILQCKCYG